MYTHKYVGCRCEVYVFSRCAWWNNCIVGWGNNIMWQVCCFQLMLWKARNFYTFDENKCQYIPLWINWIVSIYLFANVEEFINFNIFKIHQLKTYVKYYTNYRAIKNTLIRDIFCTQEPNMSLTCFWKEVFVLY